MDEDGLIQRYFAPLAAGAPGAAGLRDDAAVLEPPGPGALVVTSDTLIADVHFLAADPPQDAARKALRVNLSDLAAKGARPFAYLLNLTLPTIAAPEPTVAAIAAGLARDQAAYGVALIGGDTTAGPGPLTLSVTAFGLAPDGVVRRTTAQAGDLVGVTGAVGGAGGGLALARAGDPGTDAAARTLLARYRAPEPRLEFGAALGGFASAAADVSDGLILDAARIARASGLGCRIDLEAVPMDPALPPDADRLTAATAGDDYEIVFACPAARLEVAREAADRAGLPVTIIGRLEVGDGLVVRDGAGRVVEPARLGFQHF